MAGLAEYAVVPATDVFPLADGCRSRSRPCSDARSSPPTARCGTARPARRRAHRRRGRRRRRHQRHSDRARRSAPRRSSRSTSRTTSSRPRDASAPPTSSTQHDRRRGGVRELTDGRGVDVAFEVLGLPQTFTQAFEMIRDGGRMVAVGIAPARPRRRSRSPGWCGASCASSGRTAPAPQRHAGDHPAGREGIFRPRRW